MKENINLSCSFCGVDENKVEEQRRLIEKNFSLEHVSTEFYNLYNKIQVNE